MTDGLTPEESARIDELVDTLFAMAKQAGESIREKRGATEPRARRAPDITHLLKADLRASLVEQLKTRGARDVSSPEAVERIWREARETNRAEESARINRSLRNKK